MPTLQVQCPNCRHALELDWGFAGGVCRCSHCGALMQVPKKPDVAEASVAESLAAIRRPAAPGGRPESPTATTVLEEDPPPAPDEAAGEQDDEAGHAFDQTATPVMDVPRSGTHQPTPAEARRNAAESAWRDPNESKPKDRSGRLQHYLRALVRHYGQRTPSDLTPQNLPVHARYLEHRHHGIARRLGRLLDPGSQRHQRAAALAQQPLTRRDAFNIACQHRDALLREANECAQYWSRVVRDGRLPSGFSLKLAAYNTRSIAHPWTAADTSTLERLAQIDTELDLEDARHKQDEAELAVERSRGGSKGRARGERRSNHHADLDDGSER